MITIKNADESDITPLSELAQLCFIDTFGHLYSKENLLEHLQETCSPDFFREALLHDQILLAKKENKLFGYIKYGEMGLPVESIFDDAKEIHRLYVHPEFKRKNIGRSLMQYALDDIFLKSAKHLYLSVYEDNIAAQKFYQNYGFSIVGEYDYYVGSHIDREFIMYRKNTE